MRRAPYNLPITLLIRMSLQADLPTHGMDYLSIIRLSRLDS